MLTALFQGNRSAFEADNVNRLQAGKILRIPDAEGVRQMAATAPVSRLSPISDFGRYRQKLAEQAAAGPQLGAGPPEQRGARSRQRSRTERPAAAGSTDQLKVSKRETPRRRWRRWREVRRRLQALEEDLSPGTRPCVKANARLAELERASKNSSVWLS